MTTHTPHSHEHGHAHDHDHSHSHDHGHGARRPSTSSPSRAAGRPGPHVRAGGRAEHVDRRRAGHLRLHRALDRAPRRRRPQSLRRPGPACSPGRAVWLGTRQPSPRYTFGLGSSSILASLANAALLLFACGAIVLESIQRLLEPGAGRGPRRVHRRDARARRERLLGVALHARQQGGPERARRVPPHGRRRRDLRRRRGERARHPVFRLELDRSGDEPRRRVGDRVRHLGPRARRDASRDGGRAAERRHAAHQEVPVGHSGRRRCARPARVGAVHDRERDDRAPRDARRAIRATRSSMASCGPCARTTRCTTRRCRSNLARRITLVRCTRGADFRAARAHGTVRRNRERAAYTGGRDVSGRSACSPQS